MGAGALGTTVTVTPRLIPPDSLGVFGGTFDPIHLAHLAVAGRPPGRSGSRASCSSPPAAAAQAGPADHAGHHRLAMVGPAIAGNGRFVVDRREIDRGGLSYTVDTLEDLHAARLAEGASGDLTLVLSAEAFLGLMTWREPRRVMELARVVVAPRDGYPDAGPAFLAEYMPDLADRATFLDGPRLRLSASELRARAAAGRSLRYLVPDAVAAYIGDHALYQHSRRDPPS